ncbi:MAG: hypothetical protein JWP35_3535 [Caulobacter sp.]|nr:hypothetical protein [Caulobacter sp.]
MGSLDDGGSMTRRTLTSSVAFLAVLADIGAVGNGGWVQLVPMGKFQARDTRAPWELRDRSHADQVVASTMAWAAGQDLVIDYDHQSEAALKLQGAVAPAAGWMKQLEVRDDGIWARVDWTSPATAKLAALEYRYISPVFLFDPKTGAVETILRAGLTNNPALSDLAAVAAQDLVDQEDQDDMLKKIAAALGLADTATEAEVLAVCGTLAATQASIKTIAQAAGLDDKADATAICAAVKTAVEAGTPDPSKYAPLSVVAELQAQVTTLTTTNAVDKATLAVDEATAAGKVTPGNRAWALDHATKDLASFNKFVANAPVVLSAGGIADLNKPDPATAVLSAEDKASCALLGVDEAAFLETRKKELAQ